jgi:two-component system response regulator MtrA
MPDDLPAPGPHSILIVDDSPETRRLLSVLLQAEGYRLLVARDGPEALRIVERAGALSLVILDVMMPGMDGLEACRRIRQRGDDPYTPIILATALSDEADIVKGLAAGADDYVTKPFRHAEVVARVRTALRLKEALDGLVVAREIAIAGAMATTLEHEVNNPLSAVVGNIELVLARSHPDEKTRHRLQAALEGAHRIRDVVARLTRIEKVVTTVYLNSVRMVDFGRSCPPDAPAERAEADPPPRRRTSPASAGGIG